MTKPAIAVLVIAVSYTVLVWAVGYIVGRASGRAAALRSLPGRYVPAGTQADAVQNDIADQRPEWRAYRRTPIRLECGCLDICTDQRPGHPSTRREAERARALDDDIYGRNG